MEMLGVLNPASKIPTPHLDTMAAGGKVFTHAHATSSVCTPSRYSLLTGQYCWRSRLKAGIVWQWDSPLIEEDQTTVAHLLKRQGYGTACIGKWHLGWDWKNADGKSIGEQLPFGCMDHDVRRKVGEEVDYHQPIAGGPVDRGFDYYFGVDVPNFPPYCWFENDRVTEIPGAEKPADMYGSPGAAVPNWRLEDMLPEFAQRAVNYIEQAAQNDEPFFLYLPLTSPHSPIVPNEPFQGQSGAGNFGDFVMETDWVVGQVRAALQRSGVADNTLLLFTSDNGPERQVGDDIGAYQRLQEYDHASMGPWRGIKRDVWEGGHRVPFIAEWPAQIQAGTDCGELVCLSDVFATLADITQAETSRDEAEDSFSMLPLLQGADTGLRKYGVYHSQNGTFAISQGDWVLIDGPNGGDNEEPEWFRQQRGYQDHHQPGELYHLTDDPTEQKNLYAEHPEQASRLKQLLEEIQAGDHRVSCGGVGEEGDMPA